MIYKKTYKIEGKIISKCDITNMINNILDKFPKEKEFLVEIEAEFNDGTSIKDNDISIFEHVYFEKILLQKIHVHIRYNYEDRVYITIYNRDSYNRAEIETYDKSLYDSVCHSIEENLNLMKNQNKIYKLSSSNWGYFLVYIISLMLEILIIAILKAIFKFDLPTVIIVAMVFLFPTIIATYFINYIDKNYPINQFDFGDSSVNKFNKEKSYVYKFIMFIITNIILPIIISILIK